MEQVESALRHIPQVEKILQLPEVSPFIPLLGRITVASLVREEISRYREQLKGGSEASNGELVASIVRRCTGKKREKLQRVINGTGVIIHTNLGRSPVSSDILKRLASSLSGYCNLELQLDSGRRGKRGGYAEELICQLTSAEDAIVVNNNAASVFLLLHHFGRGREVIVSRGELIQIGGGFRIPDIMAHTGSILVEVGTTNITELEDYRRAITERTAMIFSAHRANFTMEGFTGSPTLKEIASLKTPSLLLVRDLGSGNLITDERIPPPGEPTVAFELSQGADLLCFSGDKLLGGCQAGIIVGRRDLISRLRRDPLMRVLRVDKVTYFILQETLVQYANGSGGSLPLRGMIFQDRAAVSKKVSRLLKILPKQVRGFLKRVPAWSTFGGGALPAVEMESEGVQVLVPGASAEEISSLLLSEEAPVAGYIRDDHYTLDMRTVSEEDLRPLASSIMNVITNLKGIG